MKVLFTAEAKAVGGRNGHSEASDKSVSVDLSIPKAMGGPGKPNTTTPEHLFAVGYAACFGSALDYVASQKKIAIPGASVTSRVSIGTRADGGFQLAVVLEVGLPGHEKAAADALVAAAHQVCPYSHATRNNIEVTLTTVV
ncbi:MAG: organic hydroperoxide resistance protein [Phycisphaerales bacterium]|nr:organic hydroperoxide resistance protein [Phycisphaerales bacterium]